MFIKKKDYEEMVRKYEEEIDHYITISGALLATVHDSNLYTRCAISELKNMKDISEVDKVLFDLEFVRVLTEREYRLAREKDRERHSG